MTGKHILSQQNNEIAIFYCVDKHYRHVAFDTLFCSEKKNVAIA